MQTINQEQNFSLGGRTAKRLGYGAMQLARAPAFSGHRATGTRRLPSYAKLWPPVSTISTRATFTGRTSPTRSFARHFCPIPAFSSSSPRSARAAPHGILPLAPQN